VEFGCVIAAAIGDLLPAGAPKGNGSRTVFSRGSNAVRGDPARLHQVVANLLDNVIKFTQEGCEISVGVSQRDGQAEIKVAGNGQGIAPEFLPQLFDRFQQQDGSRTRRHGGLGLGLSIVRQLVQLQHGGIQASSAGKDQGATFTVTLPAKRNASRIRHCWPRLMSCWHRAAADSKPRRCAPGRRARAAVC